MLERHPLELKLGQTEGRDIIPSAMDWSQDLHWNLVQATAHIAASQNQRIELPGYHSRQVRLMSPCEPGRC
jgi:hypothetical protein